MNILVVSVDAFPAMGGVSSMSHHLANALALARHQIVFLGPRGSMVPRGFERDYLLCEDWESDVRKRSGPEGLLQDERIKHLIARVIQRYRIDRVLLMHPFYYAIGALSACREIGIPCSVYFHGFELRSQLRSKYPRDHHALIRHRKLDTLRERTFYTIGVADEILVNSTYTASLFASFQVTPPLRVTGCGIEASLLERETQTSPRYDAHERATRRDTLGLPKHGACLGFVGRLVPSKRVERLLNLCRTNRQLSSVIIGGGPEETRLKDMTKRLGLQERVHFVGQVVEHRKWDYLRSIDFMCLLSEPDETNGSVEGFGISLLEGAAAGAVPTTSGTGGMLDVVQHSKNGLVLPSDDANAARLIEEICRDKAAMNSLVEQARERIAERFTWNRIAHSVAAAW